MKALTFKGFVSEAREISAEEEDSMRQLGETAKKLEYLLKVGLIDQSGYFKEIRDIAATATKFIKGLQINPREAEDLEIIKKIGRSTGVAALDALNTPGAQALMEQGLHLVSSPTQIANGTLVWSIDPNYRPANGWGLGFFPGIRAIRRMTPKGVDLGVRWKTGSMDIKIKSWKAGDHSSVLDFYDKAMQWAAENIDFEDVKLKPEPRSWKYYTKRTTGRRPQFNQELHDMQLQVDNLLNMARERRFSGNPIEAYNFALSAWTIKKKMGEIENDREKIADAEDAIFRIKQDIEKIKNGNQ